MNLLGLSPSELFFISGIIITAGIWFYFFKTRKRQSLLLSLILLMIFFLTRLGLTLTPEISPSLYLYLHIGSLLILALALLRLFLKVFIEDFLERSQNVCVPKILQDLLQLGAFLVVAIIILKEYFKLDTSILVTSSVISIVIGLALQDTLGNFFAGLAIQMQRPFEEGDWVSFNNRVGQIRSIDWRATRIETADADYLIVPNSEIAKASFINYSAPTRKHRIVIPMGVSYQAPPNFVKQVIMDIIENEPLVLKKPEPTIILVNYNDFSIDYEIRIYIDNFDMYKLIIDSIYTKIWYQFKRYDISIPFPIRDVYLHEVKQKDHKEIETEEIQAAIKLLKNVDFLKPLSENELETLAKGAKVLYYTTGERIIKQGTPGNTFYIVRKGEVNIVKNGETIKTLSATNFFGELSLLVGSDRTASVIAQNDCQLISISANNFKEIIMKNPTITEEISTIITSRQLELDATERDAEEELVAVGGQEKSFRFLRKMKKFFGL